MRNHGECEYLGSVNFGSHWLLHRTGWLYCMCFNEGIFLLCLRFEIDLSRVSPNERQHYTHVLDPGKGRLMFLITLRPCWGVSISDVGAAPLEKADEKDVIVEKFVSLFLF